MDIVLDPGQPREALAARIRAALLPGLTLQPPGRSAETADRMVRAFRFNLNALASLTLLVGVFLIANAVSISVLRRRPEIATLRAIGATRSSIFAVFVAEGLGVGLAGTLLGEAGGIFLSRAALASGRRDRVERLSPGGEDRRGRISPGGGARRRRRNGRRASGDPPAGGGGDAGRAFPRDAARLDRGRARAEPARTGRGARPC